MDDKITQLPKTSNILIEFQKLKQRLKESSHYKENDEIKWTQQEKDALLEEASKFTAETIVKGLADLQLNISKSIDDVVRKIKDEFLKLDTLRHAIHIQQENLRLMHNVKIAAEALNILTKNTQAELEKLETESQHEIQRIQDEITTTKRTWKEAQKEAELNLKEKKQLQQRERSKNEADYIYETTRERKIELDELAQKKQNLEHEIAEKEQELKENWNYREEQLAQQESVFAELNKKIATFPAQIEQAVKSAREQLEKELRDDAAIKENLFEKEVAAKNKLYQEKIRSLESAVQQQQTTISDLTRQLQNVLKENQNMADKTIGGSSKKSQSSRTEK